MQTKDGSDVSAIALAKFGFLIFLSIANKTFENIWYFQTNLVAVVVRQKWKRNWERGELVVVVVGVGGGGGGDWW